MLSIRKAQDDSDHCTLNILPCRIQYSGPTKVTKRFWNPSTETDGSRIAYFRGRRLKARAVKLPPTYQGIILKHPDKNTAQASSKPELPLYDEVDEMDDDLEEEPAEPVQLVDAISKFDDLFVWGHDRLPAADDTFVKGIEEWISFAEAIHGDHQTVHNTVTDTSTTMEK